MEIAEIKQRLAILEVLAHYGLNTDKNGRMRCPFHDDRTPSMQVYPKTNTYCCFSTNCQAGTGDVIDFIQLMEKGSKHQAIMKAKELCGHTVAEAPGPSRSGILNRFWESCREGIKRSKKAREYLKERGLENMEGTGYCGEKSMQNWSAELQEAARKAGLINAKGRPHFQHCVTFPLKDEKNSTVGIYGRGVEGKRHVYPQGQHQGLFPSFPDRETATLILTESVIDAASLLPHTQHSVLALYGTNGLTVDHEKAIRSLPDLKEVVLFLDGDAAGKAAIEKLGKQLQQLREGITVSYTETPEGEDPNSLLVGHEAKVLAHLIENRRPIQTGPFLPSPEKPGERKAVLDTTNPNQLRLQTEGARYTVLGGIKGELDSLKVTLLISAENGKFRGKLDLYDHRQTQRLATEAGERLNTNPTDIESGLQVLTDLLEQYREERPEKEAPKETVKATVKPRDQEACLRFLRSPDLLKRINQKIGEAGVTGEETNRLFLFGIATSYKMPQPLNALIQGSSGSGKTHLLLKTSQFVPVEARLNFTRVTDSSFYNYGEHDLSHKLLCFEDLDGLKEDALLAVRELLSRGQLSSSTSGKDELGNIQSYVRTVYGPVASLSCTTQGELYEDNMGRCFLIAVDESAEQTQRIIAHQNKQAAGLIDTKKAQAAATFLQDCVRMLKPYEVVNPFAQSVQLPEKAHKIRRLNALYQSYVQQVTLLHQYQREQDKQGRLLSTVEDLKAACTLMFESIVLKVDELDGSLRQFYEQLKNYLGERERTFAQREVRQALNVSKTQLQRYLYQLQSLEYIRLQGGHANRGYQYQVSYWDNNVAFRKQIKADLEAQLHRLGRHGPPQGHQQVLNGQAVS